MNRMPVYIATTKDKYELPIAVADSPRELSRQLGVTESAICRGVKRDERGLTSTYKRVWIDLSPEEWDEQRRAVWYAKAKAEGRL